MNGGFVCQSERLNGRVSFLRYVSLPDGTPTMLGIAYGDILGDDFGMQRNQQSDVLRFQTCVLARNKWGCTTSINMGPIVNMRYDDTKKTSNVILGHIPKLGC